MAAAPVPPPSPPVYLHNIMSIQARNPGLPPMVGQLNLDRAIHAGEQVAHGNLTHANAVAEALRCAAVTGYNPLFTASIAESAKHRAMAVEAAHVTAEYAPVDLAGGLQQINQQLHQVVLQLNNLNQRADQQAASTQNLRIRSRNFFRTMSLKPDMVLSTVVKENAGHGLALAHAVGHHLGAAAQAVLVAPEVVPNIGDVPPDFDAEIFGYGHDDILHLIIFYNDDFGIVPGDTVPVCIQKFRHFLLEP